MELSQHWSDKISCTHDESGSCVLDRLWLLKLEVRRAVKHGVAVVQARDEIKNLDDCFGLMNDRDVLLGAL